MDSYGMDVVLLGKPMPYGMFIITVVFGAIPSLRAFIMQPKSSAFVYAKQIGYNMYVRKTNAHDMLIIENLHEEVKMIIYESTKQEFLNDVINQRIVDRIYDNYKGKIGKTGKSEQNSWKNSMMYMYMVLGDPEIPDESGVAIEYKIPATSKRVDFIVSGKSELSRETAVIIELKQWEKLSAVKNKDGIVSTFLGGNVRETTHPSYQAWSYANHLNDYNSNVQERHIDVVPCAYLHNYEKQELDDPLTDEVYDEYIKEAPPFTKKDIVHLQNFIKKHIKYGDNKRTLYDIEYGKIRPSKSLQDAISSMLKGNQEFVMLDDQKVIYEKALELGKLANNRNKKQVLIVEGGPGTGKSVLAINLLVEFTKNELVCQYVTKNAAPREIYSYKLSGEMKKGRINNLFKGSGCFTETEKDEFDCLIVDEAHRLNKKSGMFKNKGENQIKEIIFSSKFSVFFIDESQRVHIEDNGSIEEIEKYAKLVNAECHKVELSSQFRCNGSDGFISWLDDVLEIRESANSDGFDIDYDIRVLDSPNEVYSVIKEKNAINNKARMLAGYCWQWKKAGRNDSNYSDIVIPEHGFGMSWNLANTSTWAVDPKSVEEIGCIHTSQGLEFDYVGVIIGKDLTYDGEKVATDYTQRASTDRSLFGIKKLFDESPEEAQRIADSIIRNTYKTLITRGQKGCYIYCDDRNMSDYLKERIDGSNMNKTGVGYDNILKQKASFAYVAEKSDRHD